MLHSVEIPLISVLGISPNDMITDYSINKMSSQKDEEQKAAGNYFFLES
jgi:hypothetical protein